MTHTAFKIKGILIEDTKAWQAIQQQALSIWEALGADKDDRPPEMPPPEMLEKWTESETAEDLVLEWNILRDWITGHGCRLQGNGKVVRLPKATWGTITVNPEAPYEGDALKRNEKIGGLLTQLLKTQKEPLVLAINGAWGSGKTTLLNMWIPEAEKTFSLIHFNAWETDYAKDPLVALVAELKDTLAGVAPEEKMRDFMRIVANVAVKGLSGGFLSASDLSPEEMKAPSKKATEQLLAEYEGTRKLLNTFRQSLAELAASLDNKPLVFVIDELDRCRPTYAIELLERIKHLFAVKGVCFVLALDKKQLGESIKAVYGNIHSEGYLRRFIDLTYNLPTVTPNDYIHMLLQQAHLLDYFEARTTQDGAADWIQDTLSYLARVLKFSLRDIEHIVRQVSLASRATEHNMILSPLILAVLTCIKYYDETLYHDLCQGKIGADKVLEALPLLQKDNTNQQVHLSVEAALRYIDQTYAWNEWLQASEKSEAEKFRAGETDQLPSMIKQIYSWHQSMLTANTSGLLKLLYERLELVQPLIG